MIILQPYENRILVPVPHLQWREPSLSQPRDALGNQNQTRFRVRARLHDGHIAWAGWFDDRDELDAFYWDLAQHIGCGGNAPNLHHFNDVWGDPELLPHLSFELATQVFYSGNNNYTQVNRPNDWDDTFNTARAVGPGGGGGIRTVASHSNVGGGGGGAFAQTANFTFPTRLYVFTESSVVTPTAPSGTNSAIDGETGSASALSTKNTGVVFPTDYIVCAGPGAGGKAEGRATSAVGGAGGTTAASVGALKRAGGRGGNGAVADDRRATGGGGAAGPDANGGNGTNQSGTGASKGGDGNGGNGGTGSAGGAEADGGDGSEFDPAHGTGGGGGGFQFTDTQSSPAAGNSGGKYGGGGGGVTRNGSGRATKSGNGGGSLIVLDYRPKTSGGFNMPNMGL